MNLGYAMFYSFHEMCCPYVIAGMFGFDKEKVEEHFSRLIELNTASTEQKEWMEHSIVRVDCTRVYHMLQLNEEIDYDTTRAFNRWAPYLFDNIKAGIAGDEFTWKFTNSLATKFEWQNRFYKPVWETVLLEVDKLPIITYNR